MSYVILNNTSSCDDDDDLELENIGTPGYIFTNFSSYSSNNTILVNATFNSLNKLPPTNRTVLGDITNTFSNNTGVNNGNPR